MSKLSLIATFSQPPYWRAWSTAIPFSASRRHAVFLIFLLIPTFRSAAAQEAAAVVQPDYPRAVSVGGDKLYVVDLNLPGIWEIGESRRLYAKGTKLLRKPMNRPWSVVAHPGGGILVGDSATREVYWIESAGSEPKPLTGGHIGVPMALAVDAEGKQIYVGDAEKRSTFRIPIEGGDPELVASVNARGLAWDGEGRLLAVTPDAEAIMRIDVETKQVETLVDGRPFAFANSLCWTGDQGFVTDTYGNCIWRFTADGKTEKWFAGEPLQRPVGIAASDGSLFVADPEKKQVFEFDLDSKQVKPRM